MSVGVQSAVGDPSGIPIPERPTDDPGNVEFPNFQTIMDTGVKEPEIHVAAVGIPTDDEDPVLHTAKKYLSDIEIKGSNVCGFIECSARLEEFLCDVSRCNSTSYSVRSSHKKQGTERYRTGERKDDRIYWKSTVSSPVIKDSGVPFMIQGHCLKQCQHGVNYYSHLSGRTMVQQDHDYQRCRMAQNQNTKKMGCTAELAIRTVHMYQDYSVSLSASKKDRQKMLCALRQDLANSTASYCTRYYVQVPLSRAHAGHPTGLIASSTQRIDARIHQKIFSLVESGITSVHEIQKILQMFVQAELIPQQQVPALGIDRKFNPTRRDIRQAVYRSLSKLKFKDVDQDELICHIYLEKVQDEKQEEGRLETEGKEGEITEEGRMETEGKEGEVTGEGHMETEGKEGEVTGRGRERELKRGEATSELSVKSSKRVRKQKAWISM